MATTQHVNEQAKLQRIDLRTTAKVKNTLTYAAELAGVSMSTFLVEAAYEKAQNLIKKQEALLLSDNERDRFLALLERPAKPNTRLKHAMQKYLGKGKK